MRGEIKNQKFRKYVTKTNLNLEPNLLFLNGDEILNHSKTLRPKTVTEAKKITKKFDFFLLSRTLIAKNISTKKYYQRISKLEIDNSNGNVEEESQISDDVNELNSRILKATESPKVQVPISPTIYEQLLHQ